MRILIPWKRRSEFARAFYHGSLHKPVIFGLGIDLFDGADNERPD